MQYWGEGGGEQLNTMAQCLRVPRGRAGQPARERETSAPALGGQVLLSRVDVLVAVVVVAQVCEFGVRVFTEAQAFPLQHDTL